MRLRSGKHTELHRNGKVIAVTTRRFVMLVAETPGPPMPVVRVIKRIYRAHGLRFAAPTQVVQQPRRNHDLIEEVPSAAEEVRAEAELRIFVREKIEKGAVSCLFTPTRGVQMIGDTPVEGSIVEVAAYQQFHERIALVHAPEQA